MIVGTILCDGLCACEIDKPPEPPVTHDIPQDWLVVREGQKTFHFCSLGCLIVWAHGYEGKRVCDDAE